MPASGVDTLREFWESSERRIDQKFYTAYSIFSSAILDYAVARDLERRSVYSWSIVAYYYSMLHSMRLLCFIALGDFPIGHGDIIELFRDANRWHWPRHSWLRSKIELSGKFRGERFYLTVGDLALGLERSGLSFSEREIASLGDIMEIAKVIRESVNYEGLLIVHQFWHYYLTSELEEAVSYMQKASKMFLEKAVRSFLTFIQGSGCPGNLRGEKWVSFLLFEGDGEKGRWSLGPNPNYGMSRLIGILSEKYQVSDNVKNEVVAFLEPIFDLKRSHTICDEDADEVFRNIELSLFTGKKNIMELFKTCVSSLKEELHSLERTDRSCV